MLGPGIHVKHQVPMAATICPTDEFQAFVRPLVGLAVAFPRKGYGSAIFLELGQLSPLGSK